MEKAVLVIISQQLLLSRSLAHLLSSCTQYENIKECAYWQNVVGLSESTGINVFIVDAEMPDSHIYEVITASGNRQSDRVIVLGSVYNKSRLVELMNMKADAYLTTDLSEKDFLALLEKVIQGYPVISDSLIPMLVDKLSGESRENVRDKSICYTITPRESEILNLLAVGCTNDQIAKRLHISVYTVKNHVHNILEKLGSTNRAQLVSYALNQGLVASCQ